MIAPSVRATMTPRQTTGFVHSLLPLIGLGWSVPRRQHPMPPPESPEREPTLSGRRRPVEPSDRQHEHQSRGRRRVERPQAPSHTCFASVAGQRATRHAGFGARDTLDPTRKRWKFALSIARQAIAGQICREGNSPPAMSVTRQCCQSGSLQSQPIRPSGQ